MSTMITTIIWDASYASSDVQKEDSYNIVDEEGRWRGRTAELTFAAIYTVYQKSDDNLFFSNSLKMNGS